MKAVPFNLMASCIQGVLMCRGMSEEDARQKADDAARFPHDKELAAIVREVSSVILTIDAHGALTLPQQSR